MSSENVFHSNLTNQTSGSVKSRSVAGWVAGALCLCTMTLVKSLYCLPCAHNSLGEVDKAPLSVCANSSANSPLLPEGEIHSRLTGICLQTQNALKMELPLSTTTVAWLNLNSRKASRRNISHTKKIWRKKERNVNPKRGSKLSFIHNKLFMTLWTGVKVNDKCVWVDHPHFIKFPPSLYDY